MFSNAPDSAARTFIATSVIWLVVSALALGVASLKLVSPDFLGIGYGRLAAAASVAFQYGWLDLACLGAVFYLVPRLTGGRVKEGPGIFVAVILNACLALNLLINLAGVQGRPYAEMPGYLFAVYFLAHLIVLVGVLSAVTRSAEQRPFVALWHLGAGCIAVPAVLGLARLPRLTGSAGVLSDGFGLNGMLMLWFAPVGIAASYYVAARASGRPFYNHRVAMAGFWTLAFAGPLAGAGRQLFGPVPGWVASIGTAASIALLATAVAVLVGVVGTLSGAWDRVAAHPSIRYMVAGAVMFAVALGQGALLSMPSVARTLGTTGAVDSQIWLLLGASSLWMCGLIVYALPLLMGRRWISSAAISQHFWLTFLGFALMCGAMLVAGVVHAAVVNAGVAAQAPMSSGQPFDVVLASVARLRIVQAVGASMVAVGAVLFVITALRSVSLGEPRPVEVVVAEAAR